MGKNGTFSYQGRIRWRVVCMRVWNWVGGRPYNASGAKIDPGQRYSANGDEIWRPYAEAQRAPVSTGRGCQPLRLPLDPPRCRSMVVHSCSARLLRRPTYRAFVRWKQLPGLSTCGIQRMFVATRARCTPVIHIRRNKGHNLTP